MERSVLFLLASLGVINGVLLSAFLIAKSQSRITNVYFAGLLLALSIRIGKSVIYYFHGPVDLLILQVGLSACAFIGPFFYLYTKSLHHQYKFYRVADVLLLIIILLTIVAIGVAFPYRTQPHIWNGYIVYFIYVVWALFTIGGLYYAYKILNVAIRGKQKITNFHVQVIVIVLAVLVINLTYQMALYVGFTYIWGAIIFTFAMYLLLGRSLITNKPFSLKNTEGPIVNAASLMEELNLLMAQKKPFINNKLRLEDLAAALEVNRGKLSRLLNEEYGQGFAHYVNCHRIQEAKNLIKTRPELTLEGIGYEAGFNSKSSFFETFKKITGLTPAQYKKSGQ